MMDFDGEQYYKINEYLLSVIGLWPFGTLRLRRMRMVVTVGIMALSLFTQIAKLFTSEYNLRSTLKSLSYIVPVVLYVAQYFALYTNGESVTILVKKIRDNWGILKQGEELEIMQKYSNDGRLVTLLLASFGYMGIVAFLFLQFSPELLDIVLPINESRPRQFPVSAEYFIDEHEYFYLIMTHMMLVVVFGLTVAISTICIFLICIQHACAMFKITSYRMNKAGCKSTVSFSESDRLTYARIIEAVKTHRKTIELVSRFIEFLTTSFNDWTFVLLVLCVITLSINLMRLYEAIELMDDRNEFFNSLVFVLGIFYALFAWNYVCQILTDHSIAVFDNICCSYWYETSLHDQKLLLFVLRRSSESYRLVLGGVFVPSMEGFAQILSLSFSYFTVIHSMQ